MTDDDAIDPVERRRVVARMMAAVRSERALEAWNDVLAIAPDDPEALYEAGFALLQVERDAEATTHVTRLLELDADNGEAWFLAGVLAARAQQWEDALVALDKAAQLSQNEATQDLATSNRIGILQRLGRNEEALALQLESGGSEDADDLYHRGLAQVKAGKYSDSIESLTEAIAQRSDHANSHYAIACAYALSGDSEHALGAIKTALELEPELAAEIASDGDFTSLRDDLRFRRLTSA